MGYNIEFQNNNTELQEILATINALPEAGSGEPTLQEKSVTPTKSAQEVVADSDYDGLSKVNVGAIPDEYIVPSGTKSITTNGTHDVTANASVSVNVPVPSGYIKPSGTKNITSNGTHDVTQYASATVNVPIPNGYITTDDANATNVDIVSGKTAYVKGAKVTGTNPYVKADTDAVVDTQASLMTQIMTALEGKAAGGGGTKKTVSVTVTTQTYGYEVYYWDEHGSMHMVDRASKTVDALGGILIFLVSSAYPTVSGNYTITYPSSNISVVTCLDDGGTLTLTPTNVGGSDN